MRYLRLLLLTAVLALAGCQTLSVRLNERVLADPSLVTGQSRTLLLPLDVDIKEMSVSGVSDVVPAWTEQAHELIRDYLLQNAPRLLKGASLTPIPELDTEISDRLQKHIDLAHVVWAEAYRMTHLDGPAWKHKTRHFDYGIGPGLNDIPERIGAKRALLIIGEDIHTTAGRKAMAFGLAVLGVSVPLGHSFIAAALIDLHSGDILWMNSDLDIGINSLLDPKDVGSTLDTLFAGYPGIKAYRKLTRDH